MRRLAESFVVGGLVTLVVLSGAAAVFIVLELLP